MLHKGDVQPPELLEEHFTTYFPDVDVSTFDWVRDPFTVDLPATAVEQLIELFYDRTHQGLHLRVTVEEFWFGARDEYPEISVCALKLLAPFGITYLCKDGFSALI